MRQRPIFEMTLGNYFSAAHVSLVGYFDPGPRIKYNWNHNNILTDINYQFISVRWIDKVNSKQPLMRPSDLFHPIEIKQTSTPTTKHADGILAFRRIAGEQNCGPGIIVCTVNKKTTMPYGIIALPWQDIRNWLIKVGLTS